MPYQGFVLSLAHEKGTADGALWTRPLGKGRIIVSSYGTLFTNRAIGLADNAKLLANIVSVNVGEKGTVLFDDVHQGISSAYDPNRFFSDRRLYIDHRYPRGACGSSGCSAPRACACREPTAPRHAKQS